MSLKKFSREELKNMSMIELASKYLFDEKKAVNFRDIFDQIAEIKGFTKTEKKENLSQFYTDLNVDGRFITLGSSMWGLKRWYPVEQAEEEISAAPKKKKAKKKKKEEEEELDIVDEDIEEIVGDFKDPVEDDDDFDDLDDEEFDEDLDEDFDEDFDEDEDELEEEKK